MLNGAECTLHRIGFDSLTFFFSVSSKKEKIILIVRAFDREELKIRLLTIGSGEANDQNRNGT